MKKMSIILLLSLTVGLLWLCGCSEGEPVTESRVAAVEITGKGERAEREITVSVELTDDDLSLCGEGDAYLYALHSHMDAATQLGALTPVAEFTPKRRTTVKVPLINDGVSLLYASFVVGAPDPTTGKLTALTSARAVSNPEALTEVEAEPHPTAAIKGLASESLTDAVALGAEHVLLRVQLEDMLLEKYIAGGEDYVWNGKTYYVNGDELSRLEDEVEGYVAAGIRVYLQFTLGAGAKVSNVYPDDCAKGASGYAVNMSSRVSAERMEGFFDLVASRCATYGDSVSFIIGNRVNHQSLWAEGGDLTAAEQIANYEKLLRVAYTAMRSYNPLGQVYVSLDSRLGARDPKEGYGIKDYLARLAHETSYRGGYAWQVACDLYTDEPKTWETDLPSLNNQLTVSTLPTLFELLGGEKYLEARGEVGKLLLTGFSISAEGKRGQGDQAMSYIHTYLTALADGRVRALIYDQHGDTDGELRGLRERTKGGALSEPRAIYEIMRDIDTVPYAQVVSSMESYTVESHAELLTALTEKEGRVSRITARGELQPFNETDDQATTTLLSFDKGDAHGVTKLGGVLRGEFAYEESLSRSCLHLAFDPSAETPVGVSFTLSAAELQKRETLYLDMYHEVTNAGKAPLSMTLCLSRLTDGEANLSYYAEAVQTDPKRWETVVFDVSDFTEALDGEDTVVMSLLLTYDGEAEGGKDAELTLALDAVRTSGKSGGVNVTLVVLVVIAVIAVGVTVLAVVIKRRRRD